MNFFWKRSRWFSVLVISSCLILLSGNAISRPVRLIYSGGVIQLNVTSLEQYENGIELTNWTNIKISIDTTGYNLPIATYTSWRLLIWTADATILSDDGNDPLDLSLLTLTPVGFSATPDSDYSFPNATNPYTLSNTEKVFVEGTIINGFEATFGITYEFGKTASLVNTPWGFYYTQLLLKLELF